YRDARPSVWDRCFRRDSRIPVRGWEYRQYFPAGRPLRASAALRALAADGFALHTGIAGRANRRADEKERPDAGCLRPAVRLQIIGATDAEPLWHGRSARRLHVADG